MSNPCTWPLCHCVQHGLVWQVLMHCGKLSCKSGHSWEQRHLGQEIQGQWRAALVRVRLIEQCPLFLEMDVLGGLLALLVRNAWSKFSIPQDFEQLLASLGDSPLKFCTYHWAKLGSRNISMSKKGRSFQRSCLYIGVGWITTSITYSGPMKSLVWSCLHSQRRLFSGQPIKALHMLKQHYHYGKSHICPVIIWLAKFASVLPTCAYNTSSSL